jgi:ATP synthase protein I
MGALVAGLGAVVSGTSAVVGAAVGTALVVLFFALGALVLDVVAGLVPALSMLVALLTYTLKVVLVGLVFVALSRSGLLEDTIDARWLGAAVIAGTLVWLVAQIVASVRTRQPLYDLPSESPRRPASGGPSHGGEASVG